MHSLPKSFVSPEFVNSLAICHFEGEIIFAADPAFAKKCVQEIMKSTLLGLDTETRPSFRKGVYYTPSIVQIATEEKVYIFQLRNCNNLHHLIPLFESPDHVKVCLGVSEDVQRLKRLAKFNGAGFEELSDITRAIAIEDRGLKKLCANLLGFRISKSEQTSNWSQKHLTEKQLRYAATDAWVTRKIYVLAKELHGNGLRAIPQEKTEITEPTVH
jgi:ribonuclease D